MICFLWNSKYQQSLSGNCRSLCPKGLILHLEKNRRRNSFGFLCAGAVLRHHLCGNGVLCMVYWYGLFVQQGPFLCQNGISMNQMAQHSRNPISLSKRGAPVGQISAASSEMMLIAGANPGCQVPYPPVVPFKMNDFPSIEAHLR